MNTETSFFTELCVMTAHCSCRCLTKYDYKFQDGAQNGGLARVWLYIKRLYFISSGIAYCISPYASFYAGLSCLYLLQFTTYFQLTFA